VSAESARRKRSEPHRSQYFSSQLMACILPPDLLGPAQTKAQRKVSGVYSGPVRRARFSYDDLLLGYLVPFATECWQRTQATYVRSANESLVASRLPTGVSRDQPLLLAAGEIALFVPGLQNASVLHDYAYSSREMQTPQQLFGGRGKQLAIPDSTP
jgi:hypothetical protein